MVSKILLVLMLMAVPRGEPVVKLSFTSLGFGHVTVGKKSAPKDITLSNVGNALLVISRITISGTNAGDFSETNNCGVWVIQGRSCTINVTFAPSAPGTRTATLSIYDNAGGSPHMLDMGA